MWREGFSADVSWCLAQHLVIYSDIIDLNKPYLFQELSLSVVQRESAVDKANATLNLDTSVRSEREREVEEVQQQIEELEQVSDLPNLPYSLDVFIY